MSRSYVPNDLRRRVARAARHRCGYCLTSEGVVGAPMEIEHILPESRGGLTEEDNLWLACPLCNSYKGRLVEFRDPVSGLGVPLFNPRALRWREHFEWIADGTQVLGLTAIGRATVDALRLNRPALVFSRRRWVAAGWHPPDD